MIDATPEQCQTCRTQPAVVCQECMRAVALMFFGGITRHPESGTGCPLCEAGMPTYCPTCFVTETVTYRRGLREHSGYTDIQVGRDIR